MELLWSQFGLVTAVLFVLVSAAWYVARVITAAERKLISSSALVLAGLFYVARVGIEPAMAAIGLAIWAAGVWMFARQAVRWRRAEASRAWPLAVIVLLPPAFFGAVLLGGVVYSILAPPARAAIVGLAH
ncbi:MAG: hypothetical protein IRZ00_15910 [Gemmatimonadetes bacterium]|nr:hypothetical protein [Gemmatimonadota bacterium]